MCGGEQLHVWVGSIKLDKRFPSREALEKFMYGSPSCSAEDADVVALYFTDLSLDSEIEEMRDLLRKHMRNADDYVYNSEDPGIGLAGIPATFVNVKDGDRRYVALFACVHKRSIGDLDGNEDINFEDVFPLPTSLMCRSHLKNQYSPNFKAHLVQEAILSRNKQFLRLMLFGLNFDTSTEAQLRQVLLPAIDVAHGESFSGGGGYPCTSPSMRYCCPFFV